MLQQHKARLSLFQRVLTAGALTFLCVAPVQAVTLSEIQNLAKTGAINLAVRIMDREQDALLEQPETWISWEKQRVQLYAQRRDWQQIAARLESLPRFSSSDFIIWAGTQRAEALIALGEGEQARLGLRKLIWSVQAGTDSAELLNNWRRLVIQSYLSDGLAEDAQVATLRYRQEYGEQENDLLLRARIAILNNQIEEAVELLKPHADEPRAGALLLLAQLRGQLRPANKVMQAALRHLRNQKIDDELRINLWAVASEAAQRAGHRDVAANAFEHVLAEIRLLTLPRSIIEIRNDALWAAYIDYALMLGNQNQLLIGQDDKWLEYAEGIRKKRPVGARAICVFVMLRGQDAAIRQLAAGRFVESISQRKHGKKLLQTLFQNSRHFPKRSDIPEPVTHVLVDLALANSDIDLASELMATIQKPPPGSDQFMWQLRRARILVLGTKVKAGVQGLQDILGTHNKMEQLQIDRFMQVIFDLQTAGEHEAAYQLFEQIMTRTQDEKVQREIYFWMADSRKAQEQYDRAAELYLKSAMYPDPTNMDPWAQTAHYQAAVSLAKAGLYEDAQYLFEHLLKVTEDPSRRAVLKSELQKLWAKQ